jgi:hypothetical protein
MMNKFAILVLFCGLVFTASPAYAYIDPGTGGVLVQLLTGGFAGLLVLAKLYGQKIRDAFRFSTGKNGAMPADPAAADHRK